MVTSRAAQYAARFLEVGWLTALLVVPVFFNVWSDRVFEPDKLSLLRSFALLMAAAGAVWLAERGRPVDGAWRSWLSTPVVLPVLFLSAAYVVASLLSVDPRASWLGGHNRLQGTYTWLAYLMLFVAIVALLRDRLQLDRLLFGLVLPSLPVGLYALLQKLSSPDRRLDPMPWLGDTSKRVASTMGNPIFVSAYLILTVPITLVLLVRAMRDLDRDESNTAVLRVSAYLVMLAMQLMTIALSQSRGPQLGVMVGVFFLLLMLGAWRGRRSLMAVLGLGAAAVAFLVVFNLPGSPLAPLRDVPYLGRLGQVFQTESGTGRVRVLIWRGAAELVRDDPLRLATGYGPESMQVAYNRFYQPELANLESRNASPDRSHNETFDALVTMGLLGFAAYLVLFTSLFYHGLRWLGFIDGPRQRNLFLSLWLGGGALAAVAFGLWSGDLTYFGVSLPVGMVAGLFVYVIQRLLRGWTPPGGAGALLLAGLLAAVLAHFVEINLGIAIAATRTVFFVVAAAIVVVGGLSAERPALLTADEEPAPTSRDPSLGSRKRRAGRRAAESRGAPAGELGWLSDALLMATLLAAMVYTFVVSLTLERVQGLAMVWLFAFTWGLGSLALVCEAMVRARRDPAAPPAAVWRYAAVTLGGLAVYLFAHGALLASALSPSAAANFFAGAEASSRLLFLLAFVLLALMLGWTYALTRGDPAPGLTFRSRAWWLYPVAAVTALALAVFSNLNVVRADIYYKQAFVNFHNQALQLQDRGDGKSADQYFEIALQHYDRALALNPGEDYYLLFRGKGLLERADNLAQDLDAVLSPLAGNERRFSEYEVADAAIRGDVASRDQAYERALAALKDALAAAPLNTDHVANLARAYKFWGDRTRDPERRSERFRLSRQWYETAIAQSPNNAGLMEELATTEYLAGNTAGALAGISATLRLDPNFTRPLRLLATIQREQEEWAAAEENYRRYVESRDGRSDALAWSGLGMVLGRQGKYEEAMAANERVLELVPGDAATWRNLAILARDSGNVARACEIIGRALQVLPEEPETMALGQQMGCGEATGTVPDSGAPALGVP